MCCQPGNRRGLPAPETDQRRRYSIKDATEMEPCKIRGTTQPLVSRTGAGRQGNIFSFRSREKNVLDFSSYRSGFIVNLGEEGVPCSAPLSTGRCDGDSLCRVIGKRFGVF